MKIRLSSYKESWKSLYQNECKNLEGILGDLIIQFEHFGSTSIEGMKAKPVIDMMVIVRDIQKVDQFSSLFINLGYEVAGEWGISGRRLLRKGGENRTHHIHIYEQGNKEIERHIIFRDYLRVNEKVAQEYSHYKGMLASKYHDTREYSKAKKDYVRNIEKEALMWFDNLK